MCDVPAPAMRVLTPVIVARGISCFSSHGTAAKLLPPPRLDEACFGSLDRDFVHENGEARSRRSARWPLLYHDA